MDQITSPDSPRKDNHNSRNVTHLKQMSHSFEKLPKILLNDDDETDSKASLSRNSTNRLPKASIFRNVYQIDDSSAQFSPVLATSSTASISEELLKVKGQLKGGCTFSCLRLIQELDINEPNIPHSSSKDFSRLKLESSDPKPSILERRTLCPCKSNSNIALTKSYNPIWVIRFSNDGQYMACGKNNGGLDIWKVATQKQSFLFEKTPILSFRDHSQAVTDLSWSTGNFLLTGSMYIFM